VHLHPRMTVEKGLDVPTPMKDREAEGLGSLEVEF
jgi:hypothetical protein